MSFTEAVNAINKELAEMGALISMRDGDENTMEIRTDIPTHDTYMEFTFVRNRGGMGHLISFNVCYASAIMLPEPTRVTIAEIRPFLKLEPLIKYLLLEFTDWVVDPNCLRAIDGRLLTAQMQLWSQGGGCHV